VFTPKSLSPSFHYDKLSEKKLIIVYVCVKEKVGKITLRGYIKETCNKPQYKQLIMVDDRKVQQIFFSDE
jgi:hypothetical protein